MIPKSVAYFLPPINLAAPCPAGPGPLEGNFPAPGTENRVFC
jgi:hypothetical protein